MRPTNITFEVCTETLDGVKAAQRAGAQRVELCSDLESGGLTPSLGLIQAAARSGIEVHVMIRPRAGNFVYTTSELEVMQHDIEHAKTSGAHGVVIGALTTTGQVDELSTRDLIAAARPLRVTFHRAFDLTANPSDALETIIDCGADRLLTSGQARTALEGASLIRTLVEQADGRIRIMAGAGIRPDNALAVLHQTGVSELHFSASARPETSDRLGLGGHPRVTSEDTIRQIISRVHAGV